MIYLLCFALGFLVSDWITAKVIGAVHRNCDEEVKKVTRQMAYDRNIDLKEKGRIVHTAQYDALDAFDEAENVLEALDKIPNGDSAGRDL